MKTTDDFYIALLKDGRDKGFLSLKEAFVVAENAGIISESERLALNDFWENHPYGAKLPEDLLEKNNFIWQIFHESFSPIAGDGGLEAKRRIKSDSYFKLLEHEELVLARQNAKEAKSASTYAIIISISAIIASVVVGIIQMNSSITLDGEQLKQIENYQGSIDSLLRKTDGKQDDYLKRLDSIKAHLKKFDETQDKYPQRAGQKAR